jgi:prepilin peptidase CpaA
MVIELFLLLFFPGLMAYSAASDLITMTIPNKISLLLIGGFFGFAIISGMDWQTLCLHVLAGMIVITICFGMFALGWIGGGDAKLASATCLWFGFTHMGEYLAYSAIFGGMLTLLILQLRYFHLPAFVSKWDWLVHLVIFPQSQFWQLLIEKNLVF